MSEQGSDSGSPEEEAQYMKNSSMLINSDRMGDNTFECSESACLISSNKNPSPDKELDVFSSTLHFGGSSSAYSPNARRKVKKQKYLYEKLADKESSKPYEMSLVYEKRIKSYTDFLFKLQYAHNIYINLDLEPDFSQPSKKKLKYYMGPGNNSAMVRGLMKRRYWWQAC